VFTNPATGASYSWAINHAEESEGGRSRQIDYEGNTGNVGLVRQQGELEPLGFSFSGTILTRAQLTEMLAWFLLCESQSIHFTDFAGDSYEVLITSFRPKRVRAVANARGGSDAPHHYWTYTIELSVLAVLGGVYSGFPA
jgi:hypothetical protein